MKKILKPGNREVISSTFDESPKNHAAVSEMVLEKSCHNQETAHVDF